MLALIFVTPGCTSMQTTTPHLRYGLHQCFVRPIIQQHGKIALGDPEVQNCDVLRTGQKI